MNLSNPTPDAFALPMAHLRDAEFHELLHAIVSGTTCQPMHGQWRDGSPFRECRGCGACATKAVEIGSCNTLPAPLVPLCEDCYRWEIGNPSVGFRAVRFLHTFLP